MDSERTKSSGDSVASETLDERPPHREFPFWMKALFLTVPTIAFFLVLELLLALCGVRPILYEKDPYVGFSSRIPLFVEKSMPDGSEAMVTAENKRTFFNLQSFSRNKPRDGYRIFCMGGSTTYGHPYDDKTSFCGWLRALLPKCDPSRQWELVNAGGVSYASYREALLMEELIRYQPDLFVIYSGHNEFLEQRTYAPVKEIPKVLRDLTTLACRTRTGTLLKRVIEGVAGSPAEKTRDKGSLLPAEVDTILDHSLGPEAYRRDDALQKQVVEHYRFNLNRMIDIACSVGAKVVLVTPASNLRDCSPFKSQHRDGLRDADRERWDALAERARKAREAGQNEDALAVLDEATAIDDRYAESHYERGQVLWDLGRYDEAKEAFVRARDEDVCPLRALTALCQVVSEVARERDVPLVDHVAMVERQSEHGIPGDSLFLDHVHPTIDGNLEIAVAVLDVMERQGAVHPIQTWGDNEIAAVKADVESKLDQAAHGVALRNVALVFRWAGKFKDADRIIARAAELALDDAMSHATLAASAADAGHTEEAVSEFRRALELEPSLVEAHYGLAEVLSSQKKYDEAIKEYRIAIQIQPDHVAAHCNLGMALAAQGKLDEAIGEYMETLRLRPGEAPAHYQLAMALMQQDKFDEAIGHFQAALKVEPYSDNAQVHFHLGRSFLKKQEFDDAATCFREAIRLAPDKPAPLEGLAWVLTRHPDPKKRDVAQAISLLERAAQLTQYRAPKVLAKLAVAYAAAGRFDSAVNMQQKALDLAVAANDANTAEIRERLEDYTQQLAATPTGP